MYNFAKCEKASLIEICLLFDDDTPSSCCTSSFNL